jgi:hypothetical protein
MWRNSDRPACVATRQRPGKIDLSPAIPNLINANGRRQALLVCSLPLVNPNGEDYEYRRGSIYQNISAMCRINDEANLLELSKTSGTRNSPSQHVHSQNL